MELYGILGARNSFRLDGRAAGLVKRMNCLASFRVISRFPSFS